MNDLGYILFCSYLIAI